MSRIKRGARDKVSHKQTRVRLKRPWGHHRVGDEISPPGGMRKEMIRSGVAELVEDEATKAAEVSEKPDRPKVGRKAKAFFRTEGKGEESPTEQ